MGCGVSKKKSTIAGVRAPPVRPVVPVRENYCEDYNVVPSYFRYSYVEKNLNRSLMGFDVNNRNAILDGNPAGCGRVVKFVL